MLKKIGCYVAIVVVLIGIAFGILMKDSWPLRHKSELDQFFGKGNWECIGGEEKESHMYTEYEICYQNPIWSEEVPGKYKNWYIVCNNQNGEEELWKLTNHTQKINQDKYGVLSPKRLSSKQALVLELMDISREVVGEEIHNEIVKPLLSDEEASVIKASISYKGGNPKPKFYNELVKKDWFNRNDISAEKFLELHDPDFYIDIRTYDYRLQKLSEEQRQDIFNSIEDIEKKIVETYGKNTKFEIYFDEEHKVKGI